ncbi:MAG TPA: toluene monooxygenase [Paenibacillaceae bacterium]|nr:toluene monooxygenase [Paenibacillaceae bacterium]
MGKVDVMKVGPVFRGNEMAEFFIEAMQLDNPGKDMEVVDRGGYVRVMFDNYCVITKQSVEEILGRQFKMPGELEVNLASFAGKINTCSDKVEFLKHG